MSVQTIVRDTPITGASGAMRAILSRTSLPGGPDCGRGLCTQAKTCVERATLIAVGHLHQQCQGLHLNLFPRETGGFPRRISSHLEIAIDSPRRARENSQEQLDLLLGGRAVFVSSLIVV